PVGARPAGLDAQVLEAEAMQRLDEVVGDIAGAVIAHHRAHADAAGGVPEDGTAQEADRAGSREIVKDFGVGEAGVIVDHHVPILDAGEPRLPAGAPARVLAPAAAEDAVTCP